MARSSEARVAPRTAYHHGDLRRALLDATLALVKQYGPQGFTLRAAARAVGVSPGAPYHYFEDKEALLAAVAEEGFEIMRLELRKAAERQSPSPSERSRRVGVAYVLFAIEHATRFRVMFGYGVQARMRHRNLAAVALSAYELVRDVLVEGLTATSHEAVTDAEVLGWWSVVHGLAFLAIDGQLGRRGTSTQRAETVVREVIQALDKRQLVAGAPPGKSTR